jgi:hypothetical protein
LFFLSQATLASRGIADQQAVKRKQIELRQRNESIAQKEWKMQQMSETRNNHEEKINTVIKDKEGAKILFPVFCFIAHRDYHSSFPEILSAWEQTGEHPDKMCWIKLQNTRN